MSRLQKLAIIILRAGVGWYFLYAGIVAINDPSWTILRLIQHPLTFPNFYASLMAPGVLPFASYAIKGLYILIGLLLISGIFVRIASFLGILLELFFYLPLLEFPVVHGMAGTYYIVDDRMILILALFLLLALRAGEYFGLGSHFRMSRY